MKKKKIEELLEYIEERLKELEEEKEELRQFQDADKEKRCIEYALTQQELEYINKILNEVNIKFKICILIILNIFKFNYIFILSNIIYILLI